MCGVVAIAAIVAWFWPIGGMYGTLKADVDKSAATREASCGRSRNVTFSQGVLPPQ